MPDQHREPVVSHIVMVHQLVGEFSRMFQQKLRRNNYVTPKNYLDFINTYSKLLDEKDKFILAQVHYCMGDNSVLWCEMVGNSVC